MSIIKCPECNDDISDSSRICPKCGFDISMYLDAYSRILSMKKDIHNQEPVYTVRVCDTVPKCPTCGSQNLTRITGFDRVINAAIFGLLGNKRKYHWHCNNCKYDW